MISVQNVSMRFGSRILFDDVTAALPPVRRDGPPAPHKGGYEEFEATLGPRA